MSVRMRHTRGHTGNRRSHHALKNPALVKDETGNIRLPHRLDETTGMYRGRQIAPAKTIKEPAHKHGPSTAPVAEHEHAHAHENAEVKAAEHEVKEHAEAKRETRKKAA